MGTIITLISQIFKKLNHKEFKLSNVPQLISMTRIQIQRSKL